MQQEIDFPLYTPTLVIVSIHRSSKLDELPIKTFMRLLLPDLIFNVPKLLAASSLRSFLLDLIFIPWPHTTHSLLRFAAIKHFKRKQDPAGLAPKGRFIAAEAIECEIGQVGQTQKAACELDNRAIRSGYAGEHRIAVILLSW